MRACVQRVSECRVVVEGETVGQIGRGLLVLLGVIQDDGPQDIDYLVDKTLQLRIFPDDQGRMNRSLLDIAGELLVVSQFTLLGDCRKGRRPSFVAAADPDKAARDYEEFVDQARRREVRVATGRFRAHMEVFLVNEGPVTILLDSRKAF